MTPLTLPSFLTYRKEHLATPQYATPALIKLYIASVTGTLHMMPRSPSPQKSLNHKRRNTEDSNFPLSLRSHLPKSAALLSPSPFSLVQRERIPLDKSIPPSVLPKSGIRGGGWT